MSHPRQILVFGMEGIRPVKFENGLLMFGGSDQTQHLAEYDLIIYCVGAFKHKYQRGILNQQVLATIPAEAIRREKEIRIALERGKTVCIIGSHAEDYVVRGLFESFNITFGPIKFGEVLTNLKITKSQFKTFIDNVGATQIGFGKDTVDDVLCYSYYNVVGFSKRVGNGLLLFVPCVWGSKEIAYRIKQFESLINGIVTYSAKIIETPPEYIQHFQFNKEKGIQEKIEKITEEQIMPLEKQFDFYKGLKSILWVGDNPLVKATDNLLKSMGFETLIDEIYEEDLWIMKDQKKLIIAEVKGLGKNLKRQHISQLDEHREAREVPDMTGLLIANTFMTADSLERKDQAFPPNVIDKAIRTNVVITRTIDLCRIFDYLDSEELSPQIVLDNLLGKKGWLTFRDGKITIIC